MMYLNVYLDSHKEVTLRILSLHIDSKVEIKFSEEINSWASAETEALKNFKVKKSNKIIYRYCLRKHSELQY